MCVQCFHGGWYLSEALVQDGGVVRVSWKTSTEALSHPVGDSPLIGLEEKKSMQVGEEKINLVLF